MKETIIILIALLALTVGGLYTTFAQLGNVEAENIEYTSINPFPYEMPNIVIDPMVGVPLY
jgi:hypothetical protein